MQGMAQHPRRHRHPLAGKGMGLKLAGGLAILLLVWELAAPANMSLIVGLRQKIGTATAADIEARRSAEAALQYDLARAERQVEALAKAYNRQLELVAQIGEVATGLDAQAAKMQMNTLDSTNAVGKFSANVGDLLCFLGRASDTGDLDGACKFSQEVRRSMVQQYPEMLNAESQTSYIVNMLRQAPRAEDILAQDFDNLDRRFLGDRR